MKREMKSFGHRRARLRGKNGERGAALVEFAVLMPLLFLILFGVVDFGYVINRDTLVNNSAREGAREGTVNPKSADIEAAVRSELSNLDQSLISVTVTCRKPNDTACANFDADAASGGVVIVNVQLVHKWLTFVPGSVGLGSSKILSKTTEMRIE